LVGPELRFGTDATIAIGGAGVKGLPSWQPVRIRAGEPLSLASLTSGCRLYLAIAGGLLVPEVMDSAATYLRAKLGGLDGRALRSGDRLEWGGAARDYSTIGHWRMAPEIVPHYSTEPTVRVVRGTQWGWFSPDAQRTLTAETFKLSQNSDRMGLRLDGPALTLVSAREMASEAVAFGSIQVPPDGKPIVLMAERQTLGGYPKIADVVSVDLPVLAQLRPGDSLHFTEMSFDEAERLSLANERALGRLRKGLADLHV
jgi:antagonist of KipI